jgi:Ca-activated chloride channel family protein
LIQIFLDQNTVRRIRLKLEVPMSYSKAFLPLTVVLLFLCLPAANKAQQASQQPLLPAPSASPSASPTPSNATGVANESVLVNTDLISFNVTVTDTFGRFVAGLKKDAFSVFDENRQQAISFFSDDDAPVSIGVVFDLTGSMSGEKVKRAKDALAHFFDTSLDRDEYFLVTLQGGRAFLTMDRTRDSKALLDSLTFVQAKGNTAFYDGVYLATERVQRGTYPKRAVLVISDGQDNNSRYTFNDLRKMLKESDVTIYSVGIEESGSGSLALEGSGTLDEISGVSGGKSFFPRTSAEMDDIFEQIALELRHQYSIGYRPPDFVNNGKWHRIKVKVTPPRGMPRMSVRSKEGYFALANPK